MVLGDEEFTTITGQRIDRSVLVQHMIDYYNMKYPDSQITDFNEGSVIRNILESLAVDIFHMELNDTQLLNVAFLPTSYGGWLDLFGEELHLTRQTGAQAQGTVTFSIPEPVNYLITIPQATTLVSEKTGLYYQTYITVEIPIGETSVDCPAFSMVPGAGTNAEAGTITLFREQNMFNEVSITNAEAFTGGRDTESDEDYRNRLIEKKGEDGFGSLDYYKRIAHVDGVHDVALVASTNGYTGKVLVNGVDKPLAPEILAGVVSVFTNQSNLVYNQTFEVAEVEYTDLDLEISVGVTDEVETQLFIDALTNFIDGGITTIANTQLSAKGCTINEYLTNYQLMSMIERLPFVVQVTSMTSDGETFNKLTPDADTVFKLGTVTVTQEIAED